MNSKSLSELRTKSGIFEHNIVGILPYRHVVVDDDAGGTMNDAGSDFLSVDPGDVEESDRSAVLPAYTVAHWHGAASGPDSDGWTENVIGFGEERHDEYEFPRESWPMAGYRGNPGERDIDDNMLTAEMVIVIGCFAAHAGRYMYHCHILEHEDTEMMRTFIVAPADLMAFMGTHHR